MKQFGINHFQAHEVLPPEVLENHSIERAMQWMDIRIIKAWDWIRETRGNPIYMNTWGMGNRPDWYPEFTGRGLRLPPRTGLNTSQHFFGRALDGDEVGVDNRELYEFCLAHQNKLLSFGVTTIENIEFTPTWVHLDCRFWEKNQAGLKIVNP